MRHLIFEAKVHRELAMSYMRPALKWRNESDSEEERTFYQSALTVLKAEMNALAPQNNNNNDTNQP